MGRETGEGDGRLTMRRAEQTEQGIQADKGWALDECGAHDDDRR